MKENNNHIESILAESYEKIKSIIDVDTVIGSPVKTQDGTTIIPISRVSVGFVAGGGEYGKNDVKKTDFFPFAGGSGTGFSVTPIGFLVGKNDNLKIISIDSKSNFENVMELLNNVIKNMKKDS